MTAHLVQLLLPLRDNTGVPLGRQRFDQVRKTLVDRFGGATAYVRSPAVGEWEDEEGDRARDDVMLFEVVVDTLRPGLVGRLPPIPGARLRPGRDPRARPPDATPLSDAPRLNA